MEKIDPSRERQIKIIVYTISVIVPLVVAILFRVKIEGFNLNFLPPIYSSINGITAILLILAWRAIKNGKKELHRKIMITCMSLSGIFLASYVAYHMTSESTPFGGEGVVRIFYFVILITHIILSILVVPMVLFTFIRAYLGEFDRHRKLAKYILPIWIYVAVSGVVVYIMISPYY